MSASENSVGALLTRALDNLVVEADSTCGRTRVDAVDMREESAVRALLTDSGPANISLAPPLAILFPGACPAVAPIQVGSEEEQPTVSGLVFCI